VPNTPHLNVVAIPTTGTSRQRYPDIVSVRGTELRLIEVEVRLADHVAADIIERFGEMRHALTDPAVFRQWREAVQRECGVAIPGEVTIVCELVTCQPIRETAQERVDELSAADITVGSAPDFVP